MNYIKIWYPFYKSAGLPLKAPLLEAYAVGLLTYALGLMADLPTPLSAVVYTDSKRLIVFITE